MKRLLFILPLFVFQSIFAQEDISQDTLKVTFIVRDTVNPSYYRTSREGNIFTFEVADEILPAYIIRKEGDYDTLNIFWEPIDKKFLILKTIKGHD